MTNYEKLETEKLMILYFVLAGIDILENVDKLDCRLNIIDYIYSF